MEFEAIDLLNSLPAAFLRQVEGMEVGGAYEICVGKGDSFGQHVIHAVLTPGAVHFMSFVRTSGRQSSLTEIGTISRTDKGYEIRANGCLYDISALSNLDFQPKEYGVAVVTRKQVLFTVPVDSPNEAAASLYQLTKEALSLRKTQLRLPSDVELIGKGPRIFVDGTNVALDERSPFHLQRQPQASTRTLRAVKEQLLRLGYVPIIFYDASYAENLAKAEKDALLMEIAASPPHVRCPSGRPADEFVLAAADKYEGGGLDGRYFVTLDKYEDWRSKFPAIDFGERQILVHWIGAGIRFQTEGRRWTRLTGQQVPPHPLPRAGPSLL